MINKYSNINDYSKYKVSNQLVDVTQKGNYMPILPKTNNLAKFKPEITLINKFKNKSDININSNNIIYNSGGGDCWFKSISQALYSDEIYHTTIRKKIYEVLITKKSYYEQNQTSIEDDNKIVSVSEYIESIKFLNHWAGDLEIGQTSLLYNINIIIYKVEKVNNGIANLSFYNIYGDLNDVEKPMLFIGLIGNNHYQIIDYNNNFISLNYINNKINSKIEKHNNNDIKDELLSENNIIAHYYNLSEYYKNTLTIKEKDTYPYYPNCTDGDEYYKDIVNYLNSSLDNAKKNNNNKKIWPYYITKIKNFKEKENKKRIFRKKIEKYLYVDEKLYINKNKDYKAFNKNIVSLLIKNNINDAKSLINKNNIKNQNVFII